MEIQTVCCSSTQEISIACVEHCKHIMSLHRGSDHSIDSFTAEKILDNVFCAFCNDYVDLLAFVANLRELIVKNPRIQLIVIDSLSYVFRLVDSSLDRTRILYQLLMDLQKLAVDFQCAVRFSQKTKIYSVDQ